MSRVTFKGVGGLGQGSPLRVWGCLVSRVFNRVFSVKGMAGV